MAAVALELDENADMSAIEDAPKQPQSELVHLDLEDGGRLTAVHPRRALSGAESHPEAASSAGPAALRFLPPRRGRSRSPRRHDHAPTDKTLSKNMCRLLRHRNNDLVLDSDGSALVANVAMAAGVSEDRVRSLASSSYYRSGGPRFSMWGARIRAVKGHSVDVDVSTPMEDIWAEDGSP